MSRLFTIFFIFSSFSIFAMKEEEGKKFIFFTQLPHELQLTILEKHLEKKTFETILPVYYQLNAFKQKNPDQNVLYNTMQKKFFAKLRTLSRYHVQPIKITTPIELIKQKARLLMHPNALPLLVKKDNESTHIYALHLTKPHTDLDEID